MMAAATPAQPVPAQEDNCEAADGRPWSPSSTEDYDDMPGLITASPAVPPDAPFAWEPPALSPVRHFLAAPPRDSSDYPADMELDYLEQNLLPPLRPPLPPPLRPSSGMNLMLPRLGLDDMVLRQRQQQQQPEQQQQAQAQRRLALEQDFQQLQMTVLRQRQQDERADDPLAAMDFPGLPPAANGHSSRVSWRRSARTQPGQADLPSPSDAAARNQQHVDALNTSAVQQVWARTARLSAELLNWHPTPDPSSQLEPLLRTQPSTQRQRQRQQQQQEEQHEYVQLRQVQQVPLPRGLCMQPATCSFLQPGVRFVGSQKLVERGGIQQEQWSVRVVLHDVDYAQGRVSGSMRAINVVGAAGPIDTFFEGDLVNDLGHTFWTETWGASRETDLRHWSKFDGFAEIKPLVIKHAGQCGQLQRHRNIYMRWKEQFFISAKDAAGLTIAGFYYISLDRKTGALRGLYHDPLSSPFQELSLQVEHCSTSDSSCRASTSTSRMSSASGASSSTSSSSGHTFASYSFA